MPETDNHGLIVSLIDSLAWPAVAFIALLVLRPYVKHLASLLEKVKYKDLELTFRRSVQDTADKVASLPVADERQDVEPMQVSHDTDPRITILKSWAAVESAIESLALAHSSEIGKVHRVLTHRRVEALRRANVIDDTLAAVLQDMRGVRNLIAHGRDFPLDKETVDVFSTAAARLESVVERQLRD